MHDGHIDRALWTRAMDLAGGDKEAATPGYIKARATALRLKRRERVAKAAQRRALAATSDAGDDGDDGNGGGPATATKRPAGCLPRSRN